MAAGGPLAPPEVRTWWLLVVVAALVRFAIMPYGGFPTDIATFKAWAATLAQYGPWGFYRPGFFADYLPGYLYVLWGIGRLHAVLRLNDQALLFVLKLPAALADLGTAALIRAIAPRFTSPQRATHLAVVYLFHPALIFTGAYWGQADSVGGLIALVALELFLRRSLLAWPVAAWTFLVKPQTLPLLLVLVVVMARTTLWPPGEGRSQARRLNRLIGAAALGAGTITLMVLPFGLGWRSLAELLRTSVGVYPYGSVVAFNLWGALQGFWQSDGARILGFPAFLWSALLSGLTIGAVLITVWRRPDTRTVVVAAAASLVSMFVLLTRMHERYLLPALAVLAVAAAVDWRIWGVYVGLSVLAFLNLLYAYTRPYVQTFTLPPWLDGTLFHDISVRVFSALAVGALLWLLTILWRPGEPA